jgi:hypothetical protein
MHILEQIEGLVASSIFVKRVILEKDFVVNYKCNKLFSLPQVVPSPSYICVF